MNLSIMSGDEHSDIPPMTKTEDLAKKEEEQERQEDRSPLIMEQQEIFAYLFRITADLSAEEIQLGEKMEIVLSPAWQKLSLGEKMRLVTESPIQGRVHNIMQNASIQDVRKVKTYLSNPTTSDIDPRIELMGLWIKKKVSNLKKE
jgi:hypothetical protein